MGVALTVIMADKITVLMNELTEFIKNKVMAIMAMAMKNLMVGDSCPALLFKRPSSVEAYPRRWTILIKHISCKIAVMPALATLSLIASTDW
jgi:hypothetical protein